MSNIALYYSNKGYFANDSSIFLKLYYWRQRLKYKRNPIHIHAWKTFSFQGDGLTANTIFTFYYCVICGKEVYEDEWRNSYAAHIYK